MKFPLIEAYLICPNKEGGIIGVCSNQLAPGIVLNEIPMRLRKKICAIGSLIVNRGGTERMIVNSLVHKKLRYLILFGEESASFKPSSNLLIALMNGYKKGEGNYIKSSIGFGAQYPSISEKVLDSFRQNVIVLPVFKGSKEIVEGYLGWLEARVPKEIFNCLKSINQKKKIYYDSLFSLMEALPDVPAFGKKIIELELREFQSLQPKIVILKGVGQAEEVNFEARKEKGKIAVNIDFGGELYSIEGKDGFLLAYSLMKFMNENGLKLSIRKQLFLGVEISRAEMEIKHGLISDSITRPDSKLGSRKKIPLEEQAVLKEDKNYYYTIFLKEGYICVRVTNYDTCKCLFEIRAKSIIPLIDKLAGENRFQDYEQQILHRIDVGIEIGRAGIAFKNKRVFLQDFHYLPSINKTNFPLFIISGNSFLTNHKRIVTSIYTQGVAQTHPDTHKGSMRSGAVLCAFKSPEQAFKKMPGIYIYGNQSEKQVRAQYKDQLLSPEPFGSYTYGNRTRDHFGKDQLKEAINSLRREPNSPFVIQRFDYLKDMAIKKRGKELKATHDPCLTHDIYFISGKKLFAFHIARAHNIIGGYPTNLFGLYDAYDGPIAKALNLEMGDIFMLSSRANILLLTEEQKAKTIMKEPSKLSGRQSMFIGPHNISNFFPNKRIAYIERLLKKQTVKPEHPCLGALRDYESVNILEKAISYLQTKGADHNNPIIGTYNPKEQSLGEENRLIYFQANVRAGKIQATAVFLNGSKKTFKSDIILCNYLATQYSEKLSTGLGKLFFFYVPVKNN